MYRVIAWEAAFCFSMFPTIYAVHYAWPVNGLLPFFVVVILGATIALTFFHILPAVFARNILTLQSNSEKYFQYFSVAWFTAGAALAFVLMTAGEQMHFIYIPYDQTFRIVATQILFAVLLIGVSAVVIRLERFVAPVLAGAGLLFGIASCVVQWDAIGTPIENIQTGESLLGDNRDVLLGMIVGAAPAAIFALQFGKRMPSRRAIVGTGICGMWLPLVLSVSLMSFAKVLGARIYWKPSIPIGENYAYTLINKFSEPSLVLSLFSLAPMACTVLWVRELLNITSPSRRNLTIVSALLASAFLVLHYAQYQTNAILRTWLWSVFLAPLLFGNWRISRRKVVHSQIHFEPGH